MQSSLRVERIMRSNSRMFGLFEYTKLITLLDNFLSVRSLQGDQRHDTMLAIPETVECVLSLMVANNNKIMLLERLKQNAQQQQQNSQQDLQIARYQDGERRCIRLHSKANKLVCSVVMGNHLLYCLESTDREFYEIFLVDCEELKVKVVGYLEEKTREVELINWGETVGVSVLLSTELRVYQCVEVQPQQFPPLGLGLIKTHPGFAEVLRHKYINNQYMVASTGASLNVYKDHHPIQKIALDSAVSALKANSFGFFVFTTHRLYYFRQRREAFEQDINMQVSEIDVCDCMRLSPSDNLLVMASLNGSLCSVWITNEENSETVKNENLTIRTERTARTELVCIAASPATNYLSIISRMPYTISIQDMENGQTVSYELTQEEDAVADCSFHPFVPTLAIAFKTIVKLYCILYSELKEIKQLAIPRARKVFYSSRGNFFGCVTGKGKGTKISLFDTRNYALVETLWVGGDPIDIFWSEYDNFIYVAAEHALLFWTVEDVFKNRREVSKETKGKTVGGFYDKHSHSPVMIIENAIVKHRPDGPPEVLRSHPQLAQIVQFASTYVMACNNGTVLIGPVLEVGAVSHFRLNLFREGLKIYQCKNRIICRSEKDEIVVMSEKDNHQDHIESDIVLADRKLITDNLSRLKTYEKEIKCMDNRFASALEALKSEFKKQQEQLEFKYRSEIVEAQKKEVNEREQKHLLEKYINDNSEHYEKQQFLAVGELEKLYERKLVLTTNKLLTSEEINIRNQVSAEKNLKELSALHDANIRRVRETYFEEAKKLGQGQQKEKDAQLKIHKDYQERIKQAQEEYECMLRDIQLECDARIQQQKISSMVWETKYNTSQSEKANLEQAIRTLRGENEILQNHQKRREASAQLMERKIELGKKDCLELEKTIKDLEDKLAEYDYKVKDLEKAKEILTFRVLETRNQLAPKEKQLADFQVQFEVLEQEFEKTLSESQENQQKVERLKRDLEICRKELATSKAKDKNSKDKFETLVNKVFEIVQRSPSEDWNRNLLKLYDEYCQDLQHKETLKNRSKDTVEELNRMREHLEDCLTQVITSNEKISQRKAHEFTKKTQQNAELLTDINDLRRQLKELKGVLELKNNQIERLKSQKMQSEIADQRRLKTECSQERRRSKMSECDGRRTFYRNQEHDSTTGFSKIIESRHSKRTPTSAQKTGVRRGNNFNRSFKINMELNRRFEQEEELREARRQLQLQQQLIVELKSRPVHR